ncbi:MAG: sulfur carrier protein [Desulfuromonadales bacterium]|jgi:sulfur carrier protein|nr:sulfur carrier protein [Desulfuromonadales bacterium]
MLNIVLNGKSQNLSKPITILELLRSRKLDATRVAVEHNGTVVTRKSFATTALSDGDRLEIIQFVGGG